MPKPTSNQILEQAIIDFQKLAYSQSLEVNLDTASYTKKVIFEGWNWRVRWTSQQSVQTETKEKLCQRGYCLRKPEYAKWNSQTWAKPKECWKG